MNKLRSYLFFIIPLIFWGCTGSLFTIAPEGDHANISLMQNPPFTAELLAIDSPNNLLYVKLKNQDSQKENSHVNEIIGVDLDIIQSITIQDYNNKEWVLPWVTLQVIPTILFGIAAAQAEAAGAVAVFVLPTTISGLLLASSSPKAPRITSGFTSSTLKELNKYTRFPLGLNSGQLQKLLQANNQNDIRIIGRPMCYQMMKRRNL
ncbi:hypothetical protein [Halalkalibaculum sp. DA384]|uniref:hypothetical protein n=1 Tax=Halalkalibaculum sp. DA384 TaxID=3373606 RepID=UPI0037548F42